MDLKVLIFEDNLADADLILSELKKSNFNLLSKIVETESDYVREINNFEPDIILSDFFLSNYSGINALKFAKKTKPEIPFIMVTGSIDEETAVQCMKNGSDDYITKDHFYRISTAVTSALTRKKDREEKNAALKKLNESEERYRDLFNNVTIGLYRTTPDGNILLVNPTLLNMLGYNSLEELLKRNLEGDGYEPGYPRRVFKKMVDANGSIQGLESIWIKKDGTSLFVRESAKAINNENGEIIYYEGTVENISELKKSEIAYAERDKLYKIIFDQSVNGIFLVDYSTGQILESNEAFLQIIGYNKDEITDKTIHDILSESPESKTDFNENEFTDIFSGERIYRKKNGELLTVMVTVSPLFYKERHILCMIIRDLSKEKAIELELEKSRYFLHQVLDTLPYLLYIYKFTDYKLIFINQKNSTFLGYKTEELLDKVSLIDLQHPEDSSGINKHFSLLSSSIGNEVFEYESRFKQSSGDYQWFRLHETVFTRNDDGTPKDILGIALNITDKKIILEEFKKSKENAEAASRAKSDFLANMSHEIRTPLNGIIGLTNLLSATVLNSKQAEYIKLMKSSSNNLLSLINDILDFSKIESRKLKVKQEKTDLINLIFETAKIFEIESRKKEISLIIDVDKNIKYNIVTDHTKIKQILFNLLSNALKFTKMGSVKLAVKEILKQSNKVIISFSISDTGIGIPDNKLDILFERFTQVDSSYNKKYPGSGLGLAIVKSLVDLLEGKIFIESKIDAGTTVVCEIPFIIDEECAKPEDSSMMQIFDPEEEVKNILLADDDMINQLYIKTILKDYNINVSFAANGVEVLKMLSENNFDLILMDGQMPEMDGFETTIRIRENEKKTGGHIPVVALTAYALTEEKNKCFSSGMDGYISKPIDEFLLLSTVTNFLKNNENNKNNV